MKPQFPMNQIASHWETSDNEKVVCHLCPFHCKLAEGKIGICKGKKNRGGQLYAINYGLTTSLQIDPIEKKPLYHFHPGAPILSVGPNGCNLDCNFCQNYHVAQLDAPTRYLTPDEAARLAGENGSIGLAYTYSEPLIWFEYVRDASEAVRAAGLVNVLVTNGLINPEPLQELLPLIDAMNIDIKSMEEAFYKKICKGFLAPVLETVKSAYAAGTHIEITNLVIPGLNDDEALFEELAQFIAAIDPRIPLHFSAYHPTRKQSAPATPLATLQRAAVIARKSLHHVYIGNVPAGNNTDCPRCGALLIERDGYSPPRSSLTGQTCATCGEKLYLKL